MSGWNIEEVSEVALMMYANEPCRICGQPITAEDVHTAVFAGYSKGGFSRSAHKPCWDKYPPLDKETPRPEWVHQ